MTYKANTYLNPVSAFMREDLPAPEGPMMAVSSPDLNRPCRFLRIVFSAKEKKDFSFCQQVDLLWKLGHSNLDCLIKII